MFGKLLCLKRKQITLMLANHNIFQHYTILFKDPQGAKRLKFLSVTQVFQILDIVLQSLNIMYQDWHSAGFRFKGNKDETELIKESCLCSITLLLKSLAELFGSTTGPFGSRMGRNTFLYRGGVHTLLCLSCCDAVKLVKRSARIALSSFRDDEILQMLSPSFVFDDKSCLRKCDFNGTYFKARVQQEIGRRNVCRDRERSGVRKYLDEKIYENSKIKIQERRNKLNEWLKEQSDVRRVLSNNTRQRDLGGGATTSLDDTEERIRNDVHREREHEHERKKNDMFERYRKEKERQKLQREAEKQKVAEELNG